MDGKVNPIPENYGRVNACLIINGAAEAIEFYSQAFGATERSRFPGPGGTIAHAELEIGDSIVMVEDASEMVGTQAPPAGGLPGMATAMGSSSTPSGTRGWSPRARRM
ncbi:MAG TPA: VOC family protein [Streptosporangiaceae bacterium]|jgi:PhnB protein